MNVQPQHVTEQRLRVYREAMAEAGFDAAHVAHCLQESWVWRNIVVAETDAEAERIALPAFEAMQRQRRKLREKVLAEQGVVLKPDTAQLGRTSAENALIYGSVATITQRMAEIDATGVGGVLLHFRMGPMPAEVAQRSIRLFMAEVAPRFQALAGVAAQ
jgi:alkanesulfonate monooxygenase SsuD/methylene tetrahydromethanopterin reductase-like flavin-dependent oxidoreductase (luciferase family)